ncbi:hypothetical protein ACE38W_06550 [Chitinophaga sp. Hz27]|uniref:hypothetical protein n=1 Tax=Chitinophaga sp. Hz27 TaxID=3347169 RepID=UPI0035DC54A8
MATDGVKIIDGDLARDTYERIMELYDGGASIDIIQQEIPFVKEDYGMHNDFYHEIFVTVYALAFWEIGGLTDELLAEVNAVIRIGAGVKDWMTEGGPQEGKKRQKELDKLLKKISSPNFKIRPRKKYRKVKHFYFQPDDVLAFKLSDNNYYAVICAKITQQKSQTTYDLVGTTYRGALKPTIDMLREHSILGTAIMCMYDTKTAMEQQPGIEKVWEYYQQERFLLGLSYDLVTHTSMLQLKSNFEVVGKLKIREPFKKDGSYGYTSTLADIEKCFLDLENRIRIFGKKKFPVTLLCESVE